MMRNVLVIDDDETFTGVLTRALTRRGYPSTGAMTAEHALALARDIRPDAAVLDLNLGSVSGLTLIRPLLDIVPGCRIVVLTGYASIATAVEAIKLGATQYLAKPVEVDAIVSAWDIPSEHLPSQAFPPSEPLSIDRLEWEHIQRVLREHDGNVSATARALKMHRRSLQRKLAKRPVKA